MTDVDERVWSIRDAVLKWFYVKAMLDRDRHPAVNAADIASVVGCLGETMSAEEVDAAADWLAKRQYIRDETCGEHTVRRASITAKGEATAASNQSVRGGSLYATVAVADPGAT